MIQLRLLAGVAGSVCALSMLAGPTMAQEKPPEQPGQPGKDNKPDFPPFKEVSDGFTQVVSTTDGKPALYTLWIRDRTARCSPSFPAAGRTEAHVRHDRPHRRLFAGLQTGEVYAYWKRFDKRLALIAPQIGVRSTGDPESKDSIQNHFTDRVLVDVPIVCMGPERSARDRFRWAARRQREHFYGGAAGGANTRLATIKSAKAFPEECRRRLRGAGPGRSAQDVPLRISQIPDNTGYQPRKADERVGYFITSTATLASSSEDGSNTLHQPLEPRKGRPLAKLSPPKEPIIYYIEHTVPIRYRRWVKEGVL